MISELLVQLQQINYEYIKWVITQIWLTYRKFELDVQTEICVLVDKLETLIQDT